MLATILKIRATRDETGMKTPNLGLECDMIFEDKNGTKYYLPQETEYILKLGGRRAPAGGSGFDYVAHEGFKCEIKYDDISGDKIISSIRPAKEVVAPEKKVKAIIQATVIKLGIEGGAPLTTPKLALECDAIFEDENKTKYYLLQPTEYVLKMGGRKPPVDSNFVEKAHKGATYEIEIKYEQYSGDRIITELKIL